MSTKVKPPCQRVSAWLKENLGCSMGGLCGQDWPALHAAVHVAELWSVADTQGREQAAIAFGACVRAMQPQLRELAYHSIAMVADWSHRAQLWQQAGLEPLYTVARCKWE